MTPARRACFRGLSAASRAPARSSTGLAADRRAQEGGGLRRSQMGEGVSSRRARGPVTKTHVASASARARPSAP
jgi:hypothetical protein